MQTELPNELHDYISAILGMRQPYELSPKQHDEGVDELMMNESDDDSQHRTLLLFQADSLWNLGESAKSQEIVKSCLEQLSTQRQKQEQEQSDDNDNMHQSFAEGLQSLNVGKFTEALISFRQATAACSHSQSLLKAFFTERAVNIAFWMACTGSMLEASKVLEANIQDTPFCGGILAFAHYMSGDSKQAESIARTAIASGMDDPWTIHAVAHALTSQGFHEQCANWLILHRPKFEDCNFFMKGHMEFHLALSYLYLKDDAKLHALIVNGSLWGTMSEAMKADYWNAAGLLNVLWKAEIRKVISNPLKHEEYSNLVKEALERIDTILFQGDEANVNKSSVFSLCIFRFTEGAMREKWSKALLLLPDNSSTSSSTSINNEVLTRVAKAVSIFYHNGDDDNDDNYDHGSSDSKTETISLILKPITNKLPKLGASPEQRETIDDFVQMMIIQ
ncbi:unnamed protein product [Cylindrotheca closterium]|uniref:Tetratricopeptide repeat protein 38 n=1 Tax=Cylindrotheca closterium TaxID=2856 RepID=A0AAD2G016_9STRA|nr:unnamed protein product [Cylindrotheca closterium]